MEEFYAKIGNHSNNLNSNVNLLDFEFDKKPTKINILELSPLHEFKKEVQPDTLDLKENGKEQISFNDNIKEETKIPESEKNVQIKINEKKSESDINDLFENIKLIEPPKEISKIDKFKEIYNSQFTENEGSKIDKIYNLFGGPSFSVESANYSNTIKKFSPITSNIPNKKNSTSSLPADFSLNEKRNSLDPSSSTHKYVCNLYPKFEELPFKKTPFDEKPSPQSNQSDPNKKKDLFDLFN